MWLSVKVFSMKFGGMVLFGGTREQSTKFSLQKSYFISIPEFFSHTKIKKWVVLTTEWLPWLHGHTSEASCRGVVSLMFPPLFLIVNEEKWRKQQGTWFLIQLASTTTVNHATVVTTLLLKQLIPFYSDQSMKVSRYTVHGIVVHDISAATCNTQYKVLSICNAGVHQHVHTTC